MSFDKENEMMQIKKNGERLPKENQKLQTFKSNKIAHQNALRPLQEVAHEGSLNSSRNFLLSIMFCATETIINRVA